MRTIQRPTCWKRVNGDYQEPNGIVWEYQVLVRVSHHDFEIMDVKFEEIYGYGEFGEEVDNIDAPVDVIKDHAGAKALEKLDDSDFDLDERED